jgi:hypothetical protein
MKTKIYTLLYCPQFQNIRNRLLKLLKLSWGLFIDESMVITSV